MSEKYVDAIFSKAFSVPADSGNKAQRTIIGKIIKQAQLDAINDLWQRANFNKPGYVQIQAIGMKHLKMIFDNKKSELESDD